MSIEMPLRRISGKGSGAASLRGVMMMLVALPAMTTGAHKPHGQKTRMQGLLFDNPSESASGEQHSS
ncbi:hypothetical protein JCM31598_22560 [Desulfonatronum parangueonense]